MTHARESDLTPHSNWTVGTLRDHFLGLLLGQDSKFQEQLKAIHERITLLDDQQNSIDLQRHIAVDTAFAAAQKAVDTAFVAQQTSLNAALNAQKEAVIIALQAAERANLTAQQHAAESTHKAEEASLRRLSDHEKVNLEEQRMNVIQAAERKALMELHTEGVRTELLQLINALKESLSAAIASQSNAVAKAETASEKRFDSVNEFRATLGDQQRMLMPRAEVEVMMKSQSDKLDALHGNIKDQNERIVVLTAQSVSRENGVQSGWGYAVGVIGLLIAIATLFLKLKG